MPMAESACWVLREHRSARPGHPTGSFIRETAPLKSEKDEVHLQELRDLRREIQIGIDQAERGQVSAFTDQTLEEIRVEGRKRMEADRKSKSE
jgi:hypothetical protein